MDAPLLSFTDERLIANEWPLTKIAPRVKKLGLRECGAKEF